MLSLERSLSFALKLLPLGARSIAWIFMACLAADVVFAQSIDITAPSPVRTNEVAGTIAARDLGDSRLTDHYYAFAAMPGDLTITVRSHNLNGDVDLFTEGSLRPLLKFTLYAESTSPVTRSIFLRKREDLILRVEARTPDDEGGIYEIRFGGSFVPISTEPTLAETPDSTSETEATTVRKGSRRVSSVGARLPEPPTVKEEVAAAPTPQPTPDESPIPTATPAPSDTAEPPTTTPTPRRRGRVPAGRRNTPPTTTRTAPSRTGTTDEPAAPETTTSTTSRAPRTSGRRGSANPAPSEQTPVPEPLSGPRLIIQMQDGTVVERFMSSIRRVTVENNQIVVVRKDGLIERTRMRDVVRMAIEP